MTGCVRCPAAPLRQVESTSTRSHDSRLKAVEPAPHEPGGERKATARPCSRTRASPRRSLGTDDANCSDECLACDLRVSTHRRLIIEGAGRLAARPSRQPGIRAQHDPDRASTASIRTSTIHIWPEATTPTTAPPLRSIAVARDRRRRRKTSLLPALGAWRRRRSVRGATRNARRRDRLLRAP